MKTTLTLSQTELEHMQTAIEYALAYAKEGSDEAYNSMERRDVDGWEIDIINIKSLGVRLGMKFE